jgi:hypothetical protein
MTVAHSLLECFRDPSPALRVKFWSITEEEPTTVPVAHSLGGKPGAESRAYLKSLAAHPLSHELRSFYSEHDGLQLCITHDARYDEARPLLELKPASSISQFTSRYQPGGDLAWTIDLNKSKRIYRDSDPWITFAEIDSGPACLTLFLDGDRAGNVFYLTPQPPFNILRPVAVSFNALLDRIAKDLPAFLRLVRATVTIRGADGENHGFRPVEYVADRKGVAK